MGNMAKPNLVISVEDAGLISMKSETTFKTTELKFKLNEEFDETTADGRKTKVGVISLCPFNVHTLFSAVLLTHTFFFFPSFKTIFTLDNGKLVQLQTWDGKKTTLEREIQDGKLSAVSN